jgi:predicted dehydrogenase
MAELAGKDDVDAIIVATPNAYHLEPVTLAARNGKNVFCEKPFALSVADCDTMIKACKDNNVIYMVGHIMHFMNGVREVKRIVKSGEIGKVLMCHSERTGWEDPQPNVSWKKMKDISGGHLFHHIHEIDFIQSITGPAKSVYCAGGNIAHRSEGSGDEDDMLLLTMECPDDTFVTMQYGNAFRKGEHFIKINGTKGYILMEMRKVEITVSSLSGVRKLTLHNSPEEDRERAAMYLGTDAGIAYGRSVSTLPKWLGHEMTKELECFHKAVKGETIDKEYSSLFDGSAARASVAAAEYALMSLKLKNRMDIP